MPACYAHHRFGARAIPALPEKVASLIRRNRGMYNLGLQGPDFLFYCNPFSANELSRLGSAIHRQTGREFFSRAARQLRLAPQERAQAYLFGVLGHYALDSHCHPFICEKDAPEHTHAQIESELDRVLLELDGKPYYENIFRPLRLEKGSDARAVAGFYPGVTPVQVGLGLFNMGWMGAFLSAPRGLRRSFIDSGALGGSIRDHMLLPEEDKRCAQLIPELLTRFARAEQHYPTLTRQLWEHLRCGTPLGEEFDLIFG